jgi:tRNA(Leu) C34 or U34 (ribose-2'-O)-methylase TrmL
LSDPAANQPAKYDPALHVVLVQPEIPHNTGSVGRACVAVGAKLWLARPLGFQMDDYYLRRSGLDYWPRPLTPSAATVVRVPVA